MASGFRRPTPLPLLGNLITIARNLPGYGAFEAWKKKYGPVYTYWLGNQPIVAVSDYKLIQETFVKDAGRGTKGAIPELLRGGDYGVVFTEGESWRNQRRFSMTVLRDLGMGRNIIEEKVGI
ncbi:hypothetical protein FO519_008107 [Halicephalobus sp. NKZ332]|nr:hypothetical protein FO519_008107 [Halicephalobus sp. NKZ332]